MGKSFKGSCPLGPWLVTLDELDDPHDLDMKLRVNGELRQDANTGQMHYKTAELVSWWSHMGLYPGDVITSGSPPGVAAGMESPRWLQAGDTVDATIAKLGTGIHWGHDQDFYSDPTIPGKLGVRYNFYSDET